MIDQLICYFFIIFSIWRDNKRKSIDKRTFQRHDKLPTAEKIATPTFCRVTITYRLFSNCSLIPSFIVIINIYMYVYIINMLIQTDDKTRVKLADSLSDYVNANFVERYSRVLIFFTVLLFKIVEYFYS